MSSSTNLAFQNSPSLKQVSNSPSFRLPSPRTIPQMPSSNSLRNSNNGTPGSNDLENAYDEQISQLNSFSSKKSRFENYRETFNKSRR